ncbi:MAG: hypothetical protein HOK21_06080 [Rhodospirillaceae bacterium]|jgi:superoxide reductase|nr:hypothetical protein [Rhodospirillaceae bacterium]MBT4688160.1 hypothetical protein [Rhodospirillaceae bacterium]MBT5081910.1 hypothetical protein [Rhodospirillaceae bacterium]MBT5523632.1 hypothetical protein [Rhodospirillaceae bacterium]MBT5880287.1 hypothetical protein [Rhodospirillaceae bacterium]
MAGQIWKLNRRQILTMAGTGAAAVILGGNGAPAASTAGATGAPAGDMRAPLRALAGKIFYTADQPGRWKGKEGGHSPLIKVDKDGTDVLVRAANQHGMSKTHYIIKHILLDAQLNFVKEQVFDQAFDMPRSRFELNGVKGRFFVVSMCNLHDNWINWADV